MKRIVSILVLSIFIVSGAHAAPETDTTNAPKVENQVADSTKSTSSVSSADKDKSTKTALVKKSDKESKEESGLLESSSLSLISLIISVIALALTVVSFIFGKKKYESLYGRYEKVKFDLKCLSSEVNDEIKRRIDSSSVKLDAKINAVKEQILEEVKAVQTSKAEIPEVEREIIVEPQPPKFVSRTFFGIYKPKARGVYIDQITDNRDGGSTFVIETVSETEAVVHLVDNLTKTQFSGLMGDAVAVTEGSNPQSYETISEVEAGRMVLSEETWTITKKILVQLS